jgi:hypothetical protein
LAAVLPFIASGVVPALARAPGRAPHEGSCRIFPASNPLNRDISHAPVDPNSARYIDSIGAEAHLHADFGSNPSYGHETCCWVVSGPGRSFG